MKLPDSGTLVDENGRVMCARCVVARGARQRMRGLLGRTPPEPGYGLLFPRTSSIHTWFMSFPIDVVFLDSELRVRSVVPDLRPFKLAAGRGSKFVLEMLAGEAARVGLEEESRLSWQEPR